MNRTWIKRSVGPAVLAVAMVLSGSAASGASGGAARPAFTPFVHWGWVNMTSSALGLFTPSAVNRGNSAGRKNTVNHYSTGAYTIAFKGIGDPGGVVHVSVIGGPGRFCGIGIWGQSAANEFADVECFGSLGAHADAKFTVSYLSTNYGPHRLGYLWADNPSDDYDVNSGVDGPYSFNNAGGPNHVTRTAPGAYTVTFPGLGVARGDVQVTPYYGGIYTSGAGPTAVVYPVDCTVGFWGPLGSNLRVLVRCFDSNGLPADSQFTVTFMEKQGLKGPATGRVAYVWANKPGSAAYTPDAHYRFSAPAGAPQVTRQGTGRYTVTLSAMGSGGTVKVTPYNLHSIRCNVQSIRTSGSPQKVKVRCWTYGGDPVDSKFTLAYQR